MKHIWACNCRHEQEVPREMTQAGTVYRCPGCKRIWAGERNIYDHVKWVRISEATASFFCLLPEHAYPPENDAQDARTERGVS